MTKHKINYIDGGSAEYRRQRKAGFRLIREAELAAQRLKRAPMYLDGGYDEDGNVIPIENLGPHDDMEDAIRVIEANETAVSILVAQRRVEIAGHRIPAVTHALHRDDEFLYWDDDFDPEATGPDTD
ncbi:hypothetical protein ACUSIJ_28325 [Pseudochelatococcus sp. B33]